MSSRFKLATAFAISVVVACGTSTPASGPNSNGASSSSSASSGVGVSSGSTASSGTSGSSAGGAGDAGAAPDAASGSSSSAASPATGPYAWSNVAIGAGGFVSGIVFSPAQSGLAYARTDVGGFYRWDDASGQWTALTDSFPIAQGNWMGGESIAPDPTNASIVYAAGGTYLNSGNGVILRSTDQGNTWAVTMIGVAMGGNETGRGMGERLAVDPNDNSILYFGTRANGLYKSTDSAASWAPVTGFPTTGDINIANSYGGTTSYGLPVVVFDKRGGSATGSTTIYVAAASKSAGSNLYRTTDGGTSWAVVAGGPTGLMAHHASLASDGTLWLAYSNDYGPYNTGAATLAGQIWKLSPGTGGGTWTNVTPSSTVWGGGMAGGISVDAQNPQHAVFATLDWYAPDRVFATLDGGATWSLIAKPPISYDLTGSTYDDQGVLYWLAGGATTIGTGATNWVEALALDPFNSNHAMYGTGAGVWSSTNIESATTNGQGVTWTFADKGLEETVPQYLVPTVKGAFLGAIGDLGGMRNTALDTYSTTGEYANPQYTNTNGIDFAETNTNFVVRVGNGNSTTALGNDVAYSNDNGQTWTPCASAPPGYTTDNEMQSVAVSADGSRFVVSPYAGHGTPAFTTTNGASWTTSTGLPSGAMLASDRATANTFYATSGGTLYVSHDGGATFTTANTFTGTGAPRAVFGQAGEVWVAAGGGNLYRFTASGATKTQITSMTMAYGVGFGKAASGQTHPAVFAIGTVGGQYGFFRSDDGLGAAWTRINDDSHQYGWLQGCYIAGDEDTFGRVYLTTAGRGYVYGDPR